MIPAGRSNRQPASVLGDWQSLYEEYLNAERAIEVAQQSLTEQHGRQGGPTEDADPSARGLISPVQQSSLPRRPRSMGISAWALIGEASDLTESAAAVEEELLRRLAAEDPHATNWASKAHKSAQHLPTAATPPYASSSVARLSPGPAASLPQTQVRQQPRRSQQPVTPQAVARPGGLAASQDTWQHLRRPQSPPAQGPSGPTGRLQPPRPTSTIRSSLQERKPSPNPGLWSSVQALPVARQDPRSQPPQPASALRHALSMRGAAARASAQSAGTGAGPTPGPTTSPGRARTTTYASMHSQRRSSPPRVNPYQPIYGPEVTSEAGGVAAPRDELFTALHRGLSPHRLTAILGSAPGGPPPASPVSAGPSGAVRQPEARHSHAQQQQPSQKGQRQEQPVRSSAGSSGRPGAPDAHLRRSASPGPYQRQVSATAAQLARTLRSSFPTPHSAAPAAVGRAAGAADATNATAVGTASAWASGAARASLHPAASYDSSALRGARRADSSGLLSARPSGGAPAAQAATVASRQAPVQPGSRPRSRSASPPGAYHRRASEVHVEAGPRGRAASPGRALYASQSHGGHSIPSHESLVHVTSADSRRPELFISPQQYRDYAHDQASLGGAPPGSYAAPRAQDRPASEEVEAEASFKQLPVLEVPRDVREMQLRLSADLDMAAADMPPQHGGLSAPQQGTRAHMRPHQQPQELLRLRPHVDPALRAPDAYEEAPGPTQDTRSDMAAALEGGALPYAFVASANDSSGGGADGSTAGFSRAMLLDDDDGSSFRAAEDDAEFEMYESLAPPRHAGAPEPAAAPMWDARRQDGSLAAALADVRTAWPTRRQPDPHTGPVRTMAASHGFWPPSSPQPRPQPLQAWGAGTEAPMGRLRHQSSGGGSLSVVAPGGMSAAALSAAAAAVVATAISSTRTSSNSSLAQGSVSSDGGYAGNPLGAQVPGAPLDTAALSEQLSRMDSGALEAIRGYASGYIDGRVQALPQYGQVRSQVVKAAVLRLVDEALRVKRAPEGQQQRGLGVDGRPQSSAAPTGVGPRVENTGGPESEQNADVAPPAPVGSGDGNHAMDADGGRSSLRASSPGRRKHVSWQGDDADVASGASLLGPDRTSSSSSVDHLGAAARAVACVTAADGGPAESQTLELTFAPRAHQQSHGPVPEIIDRRGEDEDEGQDAQAQQACLLRPAAGAAVSLADSGGGSGGGSAEHDEPALSRQMHPANAAAAPPSPPAAPSPLVSQRRASLADDVAAHLSNDALQGCRGSVGSDAVPSELRADSLLKRGGLEAAQGARAPQGPVVARINSATSRITLQDVLQRLQTEASAQQEPAPPPPGSVGLPGHAAEHEAAGASGQTAWLPGNADVPPLDDAAVQRVASEEGEPADMQGLSAALEATPSSAVPAVADAERDVADADPAEAVPAVESTPAAADVMELSTAPGAMPTDDSQSTVRASQPSEVTPASGGEPQDHRPAETAVAGHAKAAQHAAPPTSPSIVGRKATTAHTLHAVATGSRPGLPVTAAAARHSAGGARPPSVHPSVHASHGNRSSGGSISAGGGAPSSTSPLRTAPAGAAKPAPGSAAGASPTLEGASKLSRPAGRPSVSPPHDARPSRPTQAQPAASAAGSPHAQQLRPQPERAQPSLQRGSVGQKQHKLNSGGGSGGGSADLSELRTDSMRFIAQLDAAMVAAAVREQGAGTAAMETPGADLAAGADADAVSAKAAGTEVGAEKQQEHVPAVSQGAEPAAGLGEDVGPFVAAVHAEPGALSVQLVDSLMDWDSADVHEQHAAPAAMQGASGAPSLELGTLEVPALADTGGTLPLHASDRAQREGSLDGSDNNAQAAGQLAVDGEPGGAGKPATALDPTPTVMSHADDASNRQEPESKAPAQFTTPAVSAVQLSPREPAAPAAADLVVQPDAWPEDTCSPATNAQAVPGMATFLPPPQPEDSHPQSLLSHNNSLSPIQSERQSPSGPSAPAPAIAAAHMPTTFPQPLLPPSNNPAAESPTNEALYNSAAAAEVPAATAGMKVAPLAETPVEMGSREAPGTSIAPAEEQAAGQAAAQEREDSSIAGVPGREGIKAVAAPSRTQSGTAKGGVTLGNGLVGHRLPSRPVNLPAENAEELTPAERPPPVPGAHGLSSDPWDTMAAKAAVVQHGEAVEQTRAVPADEARAELRPSAAGGDSVDGSAAAGSTDVAYTGSSDTTGRLAPDRPPAAAAAASGDQATAAGGSTLARADALPGGSLGAAAAAEEAAVPNAAPASSDTPASPPPHALTPSAPTASSTASASPDSGPSPPPSFSETPHQSADTATDAGGEDATPSLATPPAITTTSASSRRGSASSVAGLRDHPGIAAASAAACDSPSAGGSGASTPSRRGGRSGGIEPVLTELRAVKAAMAAGDPDGSHAARMGELLEQLEAFRRGVERRHGPGHSLAAQLRLLHADMSKWLRAAAQAAAAAAEGREDDAAGRGSEGPVRAPAEEANTAVDTDAAEEAGGRGSGGGGPRRADVPIDVAVHEAERGGALQPPAPVPALPSSEQPQPPLQGQQAQQQSYPRRESQSSVHTDATFEPGTSTAGSTPRETLSAGGADGFSFPSAATSPRQHGYISTQQPPNGAAAPHGASSGSPVAVSYNPSTEIGVAGSPNVPGMGHAGSQSSYAAAGAVGAGGAYVHPPMAPQAGTGVGGVSGFGAAVQYGGSTSPSTGHSVAAGGASMGTSAGVGFMPQMAAPQGPAQGYMQGPGMAQAGVMAMGMGAGVGSGTGSPGAGAMPGAGGGGGQMSLMELANQLNSKTLQAQGQGSGRSGPGHAPQGASAGTLMPGMRSMGHAAQPAAGQLRSSGQQMTAQAGKAAVARSGSSPAAAPAAEAVQRSKSSLRARLGGLFGGGKK